MKNIRMVLLDLDGTLLNQYGKISSRSKSIIKKLIDSDIKVVIATGRNLIQARMLTKDIEGLHYLVSNGAYVELADSRLINDNLLPKEKLVNILDSIDLDKTLVFLQGKDFIRTNLSKPKELFNKALSKGLKYLFNPKKMFAMLRKETTIGKVTKSVDDIKGYACKSTEEFYKVLAVGNREELVEVRKELKKLGLSISSSSSGNLEINNEGVSKGVALKLLCKEFNIDIQDTLAIGDGGNDVEMVKSAGKGVAMGNSINQELRKVADIITDSHDKEGVAKILEQILL